MPTITAEPPNDVTTPRRGLSRVSITVVLIAVVLMLLVPLPQGSRATAAMLDLLHAPLFTVLAYAAAGHWHSRRGGSIGRIAVLVWFILAVAGAAIEGLQHLAERAPGWHDALANMLGAGAGSLVFLARRSGRAVSALIAAAVLLLALASCRPALTLVDHYRQMRDPAMLGSFEDSLELSRWSATEATLTRSREHVSHGGWSLRVDLTTGTYPGIESRHLPRDWSRYQALVFDVTLDVGPDLILITKVYDEPHNLETEDRFNGGTRLSPGRQRVRIPLTDVEAAPRGRRMDLTRIVSLQFFTVRPPQPRTLWFDGIHLE